MNSGVAAEKSDVMSPVTWTSTANKPEFLVGKEVGEVKYISANFIYSFHLIAYIYQGPGKVYLLLKSREKWLNLSKPARIKMIPVQTNVVN